MGLGPRDHRSKVETEGENADGKPSRQQGGKDVGFRLCQEEVSM